MSSAKKQFTFFSHTADAGMKVSGKNLSSLFENAAFGMLTLISDPRRFSDKIRVDFHLRSPDLESLLVDWLHEVLYYLTVKKIGFSKIKVAKMSGRQMTAEGFGEKLNLKQHEVKREIKAVTRHQLRIIKNKKGYSTKIIFDI